MSVFEKLKIKIKQDTELEVENLHRNYVGVHMKSTGAFVWLSNIVGSNFEVGSTITASELIKAKKIKKEKGWSFNQIEIIIDE